MTNKQFLSLKGIMNAVSCEIKSIHYIIIETKDTMDIMEIAVSFGIEKCDVEKKSAKCDTP